MCTISLYRSSIIDQSLMIIRRTVYRTIDITTTVNFSNRHHFSVAIGHSTTITSITTAAAMTFPSKLMMMPLLSSAGRRTFTTKTITAMNFSNRSGGRGSAAASRGGGDHNSQNNNGNVVNIITSPLPNPTIVYSSNHLLIVNKPPGYTSQPTISLSTTTTSPSSYSTSTVVIDKKCLLTNLIQSKRGGGSMFNYLLPMHRIDQPCSGVTILAKTSKAGTRIGNAFRKSQICKDYLCVVETDDDEEEDQENSLWDLIQRSEKISRGNGKENGKGGKDDDNKRKRKGRGDVYSLSGILQKNNDRGNKHRSNNKNSNNRSVKFKPLSDTTIITKTSDGGERDNKSGQRICRLEWEIVPLPKKINTRRNNRNKYRLIRVVTSTGAKHQIRAMLSQLGGCALAGDLRYGSLHGPLPDGSVALHARTIALPTVSLGGGGSYVNGGVGNNNRDDTNNGTARASNNNKGVGPFVADVPETWENYFGIREKVVSGIGF